MSLLVATRPGEKHRAIIDVHSVPPLAVGLIGGLANVNPAFLAVGLIVYEGMKSQHFFTRAQAPDESVANRIADVLLTVAGYAAGEWYRQKHADQLSRIAEYLSGELLAPDTPPTPEPPATAGWSLGY